MLNKSKRILALLLAVVMVFALVGCSKVEDEGSSADVEVITQIEEVVVSGDSTGGDDDTTQSTTQSGNNPGTISSGNDTPSGGDTTTNYPNSMVNANPEDYRGTKIIFASTIDPKDDGTDYVVEKFEKEYGIEVEIIVPTLENYNAEMTALIASNQAPTVGRSNGDAPIYIGYFDSLDKAKLNFEDELWNQNTFKLSTYGGKPYLCDTLGNFWTEIDMVVYSKSLLKKANCPTPEELDKQGLWDFEHYIMIGEETSKLEGCNGASWGNKDSFLNMAGGAVYRADENNMMVNGIDSKTIEVCKTVAQAFTVDKSLCYGGVTGLINNSVSMSTSHLWSLRTDGNLATHPNWNDLGFYFLPSFEKGGEAAVTGLFRGWGIMKRCNDNPKTGSKAAVAGGFFLSEYLNVENYNLDTSFISEESKTFFFRLCDLYANTDNYNPYYTTYDLNEGISGMDDDSVVYAAMTGQPAQVETMLKAAKSNVDNAVDNLNDYINQQLYAN